MGHLDGYGLPRAGGGSVTRPVEWENTRDELAGFMGV